MKAHPHLVAGSRGRLCTDLMQAAAAFKVPLVAKSGAEGTYAIATVQDALGVGITIKIEDGAQRARDSAVIETLFQMAILPEEARGPLAGYHRQTILNLLQEPVGEIRPVFKLSLGLPN
jgi:L-asparaginase II